MATPLMSLTKPAIISLMSHLGAFTSGYVLSDMMDYVASRVEKTIGASGTTAAIAVIGGLVVYYYVRK